MFDKGLGRRALMKLKEVRLNSMDVYRLCRDKLQSRISDAEKIFWVWKDPDRENPNNETVYIELYRPGGNTCSLDIRIEFGTDDKPSRAS